MQKLNLKLASLGFEPNMPTAEFQADKESGHTFSKPGKPHSNMVDDMFGTSG